MISTGLRQIADLAAMSAIDQLDFVKKYLDPFKNKMNTLSDVYMTILLPSAVGKAEAFVLFRSPSKAYKQNQGLDANRDGQITKGEASSKVQIETGAGTGRVAPRLIATPALTSEKFGKRPDYLRPIHQPAASRITPAAPDTMPCL